MCLTRGTALPVRALYKGSLRRWKVPPVPELGGEIAWPLSAFNAWAAICVGLGHLPVQSTPLPFCIRSRHFVKEAPVSPIVILSQRRTGLKGP
jgi:hypothetical protein